MAFHGISSFDLKSRIDQKWLDVRDNPARAGLVQSAEDWPYAGELSTLHG
jgi:hypothetical protein